MVQYTQTARFDAVVEAIADPTRRAIVEQLARGPSTISQVASGFPMSLTGFCKHVRILERAGLVRRTRFGRENKLELSAAPLQEIAQWLFSYSRFWNAHLDRIEDHFTSRKEKSS